jgi:hypothetical protein
MEVVSCTYEYLQLIANVMPDLFSSNCNVMEGPMLTRNMNPRGDVRCSAVRSFASFNIDFLVSNLKNFQITAFALLHPSES